MLQDVCLSQSRLRTYELVYFVIMFVSVLLNLLQVIIDVYSCQSY